MSITCFLFYTVVINICRYMSFLSIVFFVSFLLYLYLWRKMDFTKVTLTRGVRFHKENLYVHVNAIAIPIK